MLEWRGPSDVEALPVVDPEDRVACQIASLSTHSATVLSFMARASWTIALSIACERSSATASRTKMPSIFFRCVTGSVFR